MSHDHHHHSEGCDHGHDHGHAHRHEHHEHSSLGQLREVLIGAVLLVIAVLVEHFSSLTTWQLLLVYLVPYLYVGRETLAEAAEGLANGDPFNEHFLMAVATIGALLIGFLPGAATQYPEAVFVMLFFQVGEFFEGYAEGRSRDSISHLVAIRPEVARVVRDGQEQEVAPGEVGVGETIVVRPGDRVPLDGVVVGGRSSLNTVALTGESLPREVAEGDDVLSGCVNLGSLLKVQTTKPFTESTVSRIISLVEDAGQRKSRSEAFITRFARIYTPVVVVAAVLLAVVPPLAAAMQAGGWGTFMTAFPVWLYRALMFLIVSCPCALVISVPLAFFGGLGDASRQGILIKGANYIDMLSSVSTIVFDKTGTLTKGQFAVTAVHPDRMDSRQLLHLAAHVEHFSTHPIGAALRNAFPNEASDGCRIGSVEELAGQGIIAQVADESVAVGNTKLMETVGAEWHDCHHAGTIIHVAVDGQYAGHIVVSDQVKPDSREAVSRLHDLGVSRTVMLTGDRDEVGREVASSLGIGECFTELMPADKVAHVERLLGEKAPKTFLAFVGDGINDAPVLARADIGVAMGALGSDAAIEAADVVLMDDKPAKLATAVAIARRTTRIARQNVWFAIGVKATVLLLAALGLSTMWMAVFADVGVTVLAVLNAMRALGTAEGHSHSIVEGGLEEMS